MAGLTQQDISILSAYAQDGNRIGYWNYLANIPGNDNYGRLALSVVRNDNLAGSTANHFAADYAESQGLTFTARKWEIFGQDLLKEDLARRQRYFDANDFSKALNLPAADVEKAHDIAFLRVGLDSKAWTPKELFLAARGNGGEVEVQKIWAMMLDDGNFSGLGRMVKTIGNQVALQFSNGEGADYFFRMTKAWFEAGVIDDYTKPNVIRGNVFDEASGKWYQVNPQSVVGRTLITDPQLLEALGDERAVRLERISHPQNPLDTSPILKSRFLISENSDSDGVGLNAIADAEWQAAGNTFLEAAKLTEKLLPGVHDVVGPGAPQEPVVEGLIRDALDALTGNITAYVDGNGKLVLAGDNGSVSLSGNGDAKFSLRSGDALVEKSFAQGQLTQVATTTFVNGSLRMVLSNDANQVISTATIQTYDDGSTFATTSYPNGATTSLTTNADGTLFSREVTIPKGIGSETSLYNGAGVLQSVTVRQGDDDGNTLVSVTTNAGTTATAYDPDRNVISETFTPAGAVANFDTAAQTAVDLIQFGQLLASNAPGAIKLANGAVLLNKLSTQNGQPLFSAGTGQVIEGALSLYNLSNAWQYGDGLAKTTATLSTLSFVNRTLIGNQALGAALNGNGLVNGAPGILPALGLISAIKANDPIGMAQSAIALINPGLLYSAGAVTPLGWVLIGASILQSLFSDDGPPDAWGVANVTFGEGITNYGAQVNASGENFGPERVRGQLQGTLDALNGIIGQANSGNPDSRQHLGLIPQRMPTLNYRAAEFQDKGYSVTDIDPLTGAQRAPFLRFDDEGKLFGALPGQLSAEERAAICYEFNSELRRTYRGWRPISLLVESPWQAANDACWKEAA